MEKRRKADAGRGTGGFRVLALAAVFVAGVVAALFITRASADYADGYQARQNLALEDAVQVWRKAAWQQDDFFSQVELGDLYSGDQSFADPVEAYVWYFLALRPDHLYSIDDDRVSHTADDIRQGAFENMRRIFNSLTIEQRMEARSRIIYILASRGSEGFITLGKLHREYYSGQQDRPWRPREQHILQCYYERPGWFSWLWRLFGAREKRPDCRIVPVPQFDDDRPQPDNYGSQSNNYGAAGQNVGSGPNVSVSTSPSVNTGPSVSTAPNVGTASVPTVTPSSGGGYGYYGNSEPSAIVQNNAEALMYFDIAANLGHPLAKDYIASHESVISQYGDITGIAANAAARARNWMPQLEYYPGATAGGVPHTDESLPSLAGRQALARVREIPFPAIEEALAFRGLLRGARGVWRASPAALVQAIKKFQSALNFEPTGFLFPTEVVRLIQMSAVDGDANSQNRLGIMYAKGIGVPQNFPRAEKWFFLAAKQHHGEALYNLGVLYKVGPNGVPQDKDKAARLFTEAAFAGFNPARCELRELLAQADDAERNHAGGPRR